MKLQFKHIPIKFGLVLGVLGSFLFFLGFILLVPALVSVVFGDGMWRFFLPTAVGSSLLGGVLWKSFKPSDEVHIREAFLIVSFSWLIISLVGALPFWLSGSLVSYTDSVFETMSGLTTTGATILGGSTPWGYDNPLIEDMPKSLLFWRSMSHWLGGMGIIVLTIAILPLLGIGGMQLFQAEAPGPTADKLTPRVQETAKLLWFVYGSLTLAHFLLLWVHPKMDWFDALNHAFSTLATGGFSTRNASVEAYDSAYIEMVITLFMFLAGANFALHFRLFKREYRTVYQNRELRFYVYVCGLAIGAITASLWFHGHYTVPDALRYGAFQAIAIVTTTGYGSQDYEIWPYFAQFTLFLLFFTGACAGSTSGGPKMIRWLILLKNSVKEVRQIVHPKAILPLRLGNQVIDPAALRTVLSFFILYLLIFGAGALLLTFTGIDILSAIGASISALGNIGPAFGQFGPTENYAILTPFAKWVMIMQMMVGRLELFTVIVLFSPSFWKQ